VVFFLVLFFFYKKEKGGSSLRRKEKKRFEGEGRLEEEALAIERGASGWRRHKLFISPSGKGETGYQEEGFFQRTTGGKGIKP